jgi:hypothetical protein
MITVKYIFFKDNHLTPNLQYYKNQKTKILDVRS